MSSKTPNYYIQHHRRSLGLSLARVAALAGVSQTTVHTVENDMHVMPDSARLVERALAREARRRAEERQS